MPVSHMFFINGEQLDYIRTLYGSAVDGQYIVLSTYQDFSDIAQYSARYDKIKFVSVPTDRLNKNKELKVR